MPILCQTRICENGLRGLALRPEGSPRAVSPCTFRANRRDGPDAGGKLYVCDLRGKQDIDKNQYA